MSEQDNAVNEAEQVAATDESATSENKELEADKDIESGFDGDSTEQSEETDGEDNSTESDQTDETDTAEEDEGEEKPLAPKSQNRFREITRENRELREQLAQLEAQEAQLATEQELLNEVDPDTGGPLYTPQEVERITKMQAAEQAQQRISQERYSLQVQQNQQTMGAEVQQALQDYPVLDEASKDYNPEAAAKANQLLESIVVNDEQGTPIGYYQSPYQILELVAQAAKANDPTIQAKAQKATEKMLANVDDNSNVSGHKPKGKEDPIMEGYDSY